jgi:hypothetical protein
MMTADEFCPRCKGPLEWVDLMIDDADGTEWTEGMYCPRCVVLVDEEGAVVPDENVVLLPESGLLRGPGGHEVRGGPGRAPAAGGD